MGSSVLFGELLKFQTLYILLIQMVIQAGLLKEGLCLVQDESAGQFPLDFSSSKST